MQGREAAQRALAAILADGRSTSDALPAALAGVPDRRERAFAQELTYGVLRWLPRLEFVLSRLLERPLRDRDADVQRLLLAGVYELLYTRVPPHAAVSTTVDAAGRIGKRWARGLANAVLRRLTRERDTVLAAADDEPVARYAHPAWLLDAVRAAWPYEWQAVLDAANERPPLWLRVNRLRSTRQEFLARLDAAGIAAEASPHAPDAVRLERALDTEAIPGFDDGVCSVQDASAQLAAGLLAPAAGQRVLDACAAPGGKTAHLLEHAPGAGITALDLSGPRLALVQQNLDRLDLAATLVAADAGEPGTWWDGRPFDRILLDAPCTATGVIRRHPDIKHHRRESDIGPLVETQARLLDALWPLLARGGRLLYATCSILPVENGRQVERFLARQADAGEVALDVAWGRPTSPGRQVLPHDDRMDGFYYALLHKS